MIDFVVLSDLIADLSSKYGLVFRMKHTVQKGFHMQLVVSRGFSQDEMPDELEVVRSLG